jgi:hypothetical protein
VDVMLAASFCRPAIKNHLGPDRTAPISAQR